MDTQKEFKMDKSLIRAGDVFLIGNYRITVLLNGKYLVLNNNVGGISYDIGKKLIEAACERYTFKQIEDRIFKAVIPECKYTTLDFEFSTQVLNNDDAFIGKVIRTFYEELLGKCSGFVDGFHLTLKPTYHGEIKEDDSLNVDELANDNLSFGQVIQKCMTVKKPHAYCEFKRKEQKWGDGYIIVYPDGRLNGNYDKVSADDLQAKDWEWHIIK